MSRSSGPIQGISELALWVQDLDRAVAFYRNHLGFTVQERDAERNAFLRSGDFLLVLFNPADPGTPLADRYLATHDLSAMHSGVYHVAFRLDPSGLDAFAAELGAGGLKVEGPIEFANGRRSYFLEDPDRHYIELTDR